MTQVAWKCATATCVIADTVTKRVC